MKFPFYAVISVVLAGLVIVGGTGTASAFPIKGSGLTKNKLYRSGPLAPSACAEKPISPGNVAEAKAYVSTIHACLNRAWADHFAKAGLRFGRPSLSFVTKTGSRFCGEKWEDQAGTYCNKTKRYAINLGKEMIEDASDLFLMETIGHEYGHHLQNITGIQRGYVYEPYRNKKEELEQSRRYELQAECLSGVFMGSIWESLDRTEEDWAYLMEIVQDSGDENTKLKDHGKGRNQRYWLSKGFTAGNPSACNTWTVPVSLVA
ncbi:neutral zinc metallopeptidase [Nonomuraea typhae]|uniref:neutral zinc metallopeptidase n=1 Tax=Nonomuraea typhae TaxID=2603600 RepID=UPI0012FC7936|nr:neutral zinc metallopeptidase [Nonomuraea typhae]